MTFLNHNGMNDRTIASEMVRVGLAPKRTAPAHAARGCRPGLLWAHLKRTDRLRSPPIMLQLEVADGPESNLRA